MSPNSKKKSSNNSKKESALRSKKKPADTAEQDGDEDDIDKYERCEGEGRKIQHDIMDKLAFKRLVYIREQYRQVN